jgi:hypothetical protein
MAVNNFPGQQVQPSGEAEAPIPLIAPVNADALRQVTATSDAIGAQLQGMAERATQAAASQRATADAGAAGPTGQLTMQNPTTVWGQTYNTVAQQTLHVQRTAAMRQMMGDAYVQNQDSPAQLDQAFTAIKAGFSSTGFPQLDAQLNGDWAVQRADYMVQAANALNKRTTAQGQANFAGALDQGLATLTQAASHASYDDAGSQRVSLATANLVQTLSKYGPKEAFDVGSFHFDADPTRAGAVNADVITKVVDLAKHQAISAQAMGVQAALPDAASKAAFAADFEHRFASGDPMVAGMDEDERFTLQRHLDEAATRAGSAEAAGLAAHAKNTTDMIEALKWGAPVDTQAMINEAEDSRNPGLIGQANFWANVDREQPGVMKTIVRRQLGLIPDSGPITPEMLDADGNVVGAPGGGGAGSRAARNNNPGNVTNLPGGAQWAGQTGSDGKFAQFDSMQSGVAAAEKNLIAKQTQHGLGTLNQIIGDPVHGWAPAADNNNPAAYAAKVGASVGVDPNAPIDIVHNPDLRHRVMTAMFKVEGGGSPGPMSTAGGGDPWAAPPPGAKPGQPKFIAWANLKPAFKEDPVTVGAAQGWASPPPLVPQAGFSQDPAQQAGFAKAIAGRLANAHVLQDNFGAPLRLFTNAERDDLKSYMQQNPTSGVALAGTLTKAIGVPATTAALGELGQNGADVLTEIHLANLAALGKSTIVNSAAAGMRLRAEGAEPAKFQVTGQPHVPDFDDWTAANGAAFNSQPDVLQAARNVAESARLADARAGVVHPAAYYMQSAVGSTSRPGVVYGGVVNVNGSPALLPPWLRVDQAGAVLQHLGQGIAASGRGPVYANGQPMKATDIAAMQLVGRPDGTYWLHNGRTDRIMRTATGQPFVLNLDNARAGLALHMPDAVLR